MANTAVSSEPLTLNLDIQDRAEYVEFIGSLINKFPECLVRKDLRNLDEDIADEELKSKFKACFPEIFGTTATGLYVSKSVRRTCSTEEVKDKNWLLKVRLKHECRNLDILIKKDNLYLVGYKGKYKKKEEEEAVNRWIVLKGKNHDKVVESLQKFPPSTDPLKEVKLRTSYSALFGIIDTSFKASQQEKDEKSETVLPRKERDKDRNINDATRKLKEMKAEFEILKVSKDTKGSERGAGKKYYEDLIQRVDKLLDMVPREIAIAKAKKELKGDDNKAGLDFLTYLKLPRKGIPKRELDQHIEHSVKIDAEVIEVKARLPDMKLNRLAFIEAVDYLTRFSFDKKDGKINNHIIKLAVMICEAARFGSIKQHVASNYHRETHNSTASLSAECIASMHNWKDRSIFLQRGGMYSGEERLRGEEPTVILHVEKKDQVSE